MKKYINKSKKVKSTRAFNLSPMRLSLIVLVSTFMAWIVYGASAATGGLTLSTDKTTVNQGSEVNVAVSAFSANDPITTALVALNFDSSKLEFVQIDYTGSPLTLQPEGLVVANGRVTFSRFQAEPQPSGNVFIAKITFKAKVASGSTSISISPPPESVVFIVNDTGEEQIFSSATPLNLSFSAPYVPPTPGPVNPTPAPTNPAPSNPSQPKTSKTPKPKAQTSTPSATSPSPSTPPVASAPTDNSYYNSYATQTDETPTSSYIEAKPTLSSRFLSLMKKLVPVLIVGGGSGFLVWFLLGKFHGQALTGFVGSAKTTSVVGAGGVTSVVPPPQGATPTNYVNGTPPATTNNNDNTPKTFSGV